MYKTCCSAVLGVFLHYGIVQRVMGAMIHKPKCFFYLEMSLFQNKYLFFLIPKSSQVYSKESLVMPDPFSDTTLCDSFFPDINESDLNHTTCMHISQKIVCSLSYLDPLLCLCLILLLWRLF